MKKGTGGVVVGLVGGFSLFGVLRRVERGSGNNVPAAPYGDLGELDPPDVALLVERPASSLLPLRIVRRLECHNHMSELGVTKKKKRKYGRGYQVVEIDAGGGLLRDNRYRAIVGQRGSRLERDGSRAVLDYRCQALIVVGVVIRDFELSYMVQNEETCVC